MLKESVTNTTMSAEKYWGQWASQNKINPGYDWGPYDCQQHELKIKFAEAYASHERERMLDVSEKEIEEIIYSHCMGNWEKSKGVMVADEVDVSAAAKALLNHLKKKG